MGYKNIEKFLIYTSTEKLVYQVWPLFRKKIAERLVEKYPKNMEDIAYCFT